MYRKVLVMLALLGVCVFFSPADAKLTQYRKLTPDQRAALLASEQRMNVFDHKLQALALARRHHKVSRIEYDYETHDLTAFIAGEARFQNDLLSDNRPFLSDDAQDVLSNIVKYGIIYPAEAIGYLAVRVGPGFLGLIH